MTAQPGPVRDIDWQRATWHKRAQMLDRQMRQARVEQQRIAALIAEREQLEEVLYRLRGEIRDELTVIDLRRERPDTRIVWGAEAHWTTEEIRRAHANYVRGERDEWSVAGHRIYDKRRKNRDRATPEYRAKNAAAMRQRRSGERKAG